ncbi:hypothetical protein GCM10027073_48990 [Streptomyces chlorus]|uniref:Uncharacterized protein n=1 Tax=Streptomyces chlorus TaxID=887452 RepID=A0ABW1E026_9ACTN
MLSPGQVLERLGDRFRLLTGRGRDAHGTVRHAAAGAPTQQPAASPTRRGGETAG